MLAKMEKERLRRLLSDTLLLLCQNSLPVRANFSIEALIGLTLENDEVLLVSVKKTVSGTEENVGGENQDELAEINDAVNDDDTGAVTEHCKGESEAEPVTHRQHSERRLQSDPKPPFINRKRNTEAISLKSSSKKLTPIRKFSQLDVDVIDGVSISTHRSDQIRDSETNDQHSFIGEEKHSNTKKYEDNNSESCVLVKVEANDNVERDDTVALFRDEWGIPSEDFLTASFDHSVTRDNQVDAGVSSGQFNPRQFGRKRQRLNFTSSSKGFNAKWSSKRYSDYATKHAAHFSQVEPSYETISDDYNTEQNSSNTQNMFYDETVPSTSTSRHNPHSAAVGAWQDPSNTHRLSNGRRKPAYPEKSSNVSLTEGEFDCHICGASLKGRQTLNDHIRGTHFSMYSCACCYCGQSFKWRSGLSNHKLTCPASPRMLAARGVAGDDCIQAS